MLAAWAIQRSALAGVAQAPNHSNRPGCGTRPCQLVSSAMIATMGLASRHLLSDSSIQVPVFLIIRTLVFDNPDADAGLKSGKMESPGHTKKIPPILTGSGANILTKGIS